MKLIKHILLLTLIFSTLASYAQVRVIGKGDYNYSSKTFSSSPDEDERKYALDLARSNAILTYATTLPEQTRTLFEEKRAQFLSQPDRYIVRYNVVSDSTNKNTLMYSVTIEAFVDDAKIKADIGDSYGDQNAAFAKNNTAFFFIARSIASMTSRSAQRTEVAESASEKSGSVQDESTDGTTKVTESQSAIAYVKSGTKDDVISDIVKYELDEVSSDEFGSALAEKFTAKGMSNMIDGSFFESSTLIREDYGAGNSIKPATWKKILSELRNPEYEIKYLIIGYVDFSAKGSHNATGATIVGSNVRADLYDISGKQPFAKKVSSILDDAIAGLGPDQTSAKKASLNNNAKSTADKIVDALRAKGLL